MPILEFCCKKCRRKFEELIFRKNELAAIKCPRCGNKRLARLYSSFGFSSKGSSKSSNIGATCSSCARRSCAGCSK